MTTQPDDETTTTTEPTPTPTPERQRAHALALAHRLGMGTVRVPGPHGGTYPNSWVARDHEYVLDLELTEESP